MLRIPLFRTATGQRSEYRATSLWNKLQPELKLSESVQSFSVSVNLDDFIWTPPLVS